MADRTPNTDESTGEKYAELLSSGEGELPAFESVTDATETRRDRYRRQLDAFVFTPLSIMWDDWRARVGMFIIGVYVFIGAFGPMLMDPTVMGEGEPLISPFQSWEFPLGTDRVGKDMLTMTVYSTQPVLLMMTSGGLFTISMGTLMGTLAGYKGGALDKVLSTVMDTFINIPGLPLVIVLSVIIEPTNPIVVGLFLSIALWAGLARSIRSQVLTLRRESFIEASQTLGVPTSRLIRKEMLPHLLPYIVINFVNAARIVIFSAVALYFLGVLPFEDSNWGIVMNLAYQNGAHYRPDALHWLLVPVGAIVFLSVGLVLLAQSLDRVFNPRARARSAEAAEVEDETASATTTMTGGR